MKSKRKRRIMRKALIKTFKNIDEGILIQIVPHLTDFATIKKIFRRVV